MGNNFHRADKDRRAEIATMCWSIWKTQNEMVWNQKQVQVKKVVTLAKQHLIQWKNVQTWSSKTIFQSTIKGDRAVKWVRLIQLR